MLQNRLFVTEAERDAVDDSAKVLTGRINIALRRIRKRPNIGETQAKEEMDLIELKLSTTSMKLVEEKAILRRKDQLKARLKELNDYNIQRQEIHRMQDCRRKLEDTRREKNSQVKEIKQGLRLLQLACRLGMLPQDLVTEVVEIPNKSIGGGGQREEEEKGGMLGKKRANLTQLEEDCGVIAPGSFNG
ncbi:unnamed protein product [Choristocarpus tenellus]